MQKDVSKNSEAQVKELFKIGAHFGYSRSRRHPSVSEFIYGFKNKTAVIDLEKSLESLEKAKSFVSKLASEGKLILFVGTKNEAKGVIKNYAGFIGQPFVTERWIGGTFTNFKQIHTRVGKMKDYRAKDKAGELSVYTKRERTMIGIERDKMEKYFSGFEDMEKIPAAMFVVDPDFEKIAVAEARQSNVPVIALASSDCDIREIDYPIIANDSSKASVEFFVAALGEAYKEGKTLAQTIAKQKLEEIKVEA
jgi:small subunit ribosomal protein S2